MLIRAACLLLLTSLRPLYFPPFFLFSSPCLDPFNELPFYRPSSPSSPNGEGVIRPSAPFTGLCVTQVFNVHNISFDNLTRKISSNRWLTPHTKRRHVCEKLKIWDPGKDRDTVGKELIRAKMSADPIAVDWMNVLLWRRITRQCCNPPAPDGKCIVTGQCDISLYKMKNQQLRVIRSSWVIIISSFFFFFGACS